MAGTPVVTTPSGIQTAIPYGQAVTMGMIFKNSRSTAFGHNPSIANGVTADVWEGGGIYPFLSAASQLELVSSSASDAAAGTGARSFVLSGLDANYNPISETVILNGTTAVATVQNYLRVNSNIISSAGSGLVNAGDVTVRVVGAGATLGIARSGYGYNRSCIYTVPAGSTLYVEDIFMSVAGAASQNGGVFGYKRRNPNGTLYITNEYNVTSNSPFQRVPLLGGPVLQKTDLVIQCTGNQAATNVFASIEGVLIDNSTLL